MGNTASSAGAYGLYADVYTNQIRIRRGNGADKGSRVAGEAEDKAGGPVTTLVDARGRGSPRRRFPLPTLCVAYLAQYLDHYSLSAFAASTLALSRVINEAGSPFWRELCAQRWHPGLPRPSPSPSPSATEVPAATPRPVDDADRRPDTALESEPHWRLRFVQHDMLALEGEIEHIEASRYPMTDIVAYARSPASRRGTARRGAGSASPGHGVVCLFADFAAFEDPLVASAVGEVVHRSLKTLVVLNNDAITGFRSFQRLRSRPAPVSFLPIDVFERYGRDMHDTTTPRVTSPGFVGWAHELARLRPEHERYRGVLRHVLRDCAVFDTRADADAWLASPEAPPLAPRLYTVALDEAAERLEAAAPSPVPRLRFATALRTDVFEAPDVRIDAVRATRVRCLRSMKAMCEREHRQRLQQAGPAPLAARAGARSGGRVDVGESVGVGAGVGAAAAVAPAAAMAGAGAAAPAAAAAV